jgi:hypothetical protein
MNKAARADIKAWLIFLDNFNGVTMIPDSDWTSSCTLKLYTDASNLGFGGVLGSQWFQGRWPPNWTVTEGGKNIALLELVPIVLALEYWGNILTGRKIVLMCDNMALVHIINKQSTSHHEIMELVRRLVVTCMLNNCLIHAKHIPGFQNVIADRFSRFQNSEAFQIAPFLDPDPIPLQMDTLPWAKQHCH